MSQEIQHRPEGPEDPGLTISSSTTTTGWSGPLPPPEAFRAYEDALPGAQDRIMAVYEAQAAHRMQLETDTAYRDHVRSRQGMFLACGIVMAVLCVAAISIAFGHPWPGVSLFGGVLVLLVSLFIKGSRPDSHAP